MKDTPVHQFLRAKYNEDGEVVPFFVWTERGRSKSKYRAFAVTYLGFANVGIVTNERTTYLEMSDIVRATDVKKAT